MTDDPRLEIQLNADGVAEPAQRAAIITSQVVATCLRVLETDDLGYAEMKSGSTIYQFNGLEMSVEERRATYRNWLLSKGFQDLARAVRETLEEAVFYLEMIKMKPGMTTLERVQTHIDRIRRQVSKLGFPRLLGRVNAGLTDAMAFETEFLSLQKARNCLEHRGGRVGVRDVDPGLNSLTLIFPRLRLFYRRGDEEVELAFGETLDTHEVDDAGAVAGEIPIYMQRVNRTREYAVGEPVIITAADFYEIAMACHLFAADIAGKLPRLPPLHSFEAAE